jgi:hypothetical protein
MIPDSCTNWAYLEDERAKPEACTLNPKLFLYPKLNPET